MTGDNLRKYPLAIVLTVSLFALWGLTHRLYDTLIPPFAKVFALGSVELVLAQSVYSIVYFVFAIPAALYARKFGYKAGLVFGLGSFCVGAFLFYPAAQQHVFVLFLLAATVMSCGWIFLEVSANPLVAQLGSERNAAQRLNFAQAFYPVGVLVGVYAGRWLILSDLKLPVGQLAQAVVTPYIVIGAGALVLAFLVDKAKFPPIATEHIERGTGVRQEYRTLLSRPLFLFGVVAQFCYVAAQVGTWTMTAPYVENALPGIAANAAANYLFWSLIIYGAGRFIGTALMSWIDPDRLMAVFAAGAAVLAVTAALAGGRLGVVAMVASSFFMSILFPTILAVAIRGLGPLTKSGTALIYMGGAGGVAGLAVMHGIWTVSSITLAMLVPALCYAVVVVYALADRKAAALPGVSSSAARLICG
ncbi:MAG: MFS transporter [Rhizomicrobium sp.]|nr:MFS transporter [Rhizomicrobium sp.]